MAVFGLTKQMNKKPNILHWPAAYPNPEAGKPFDCIFVQEHIKSVIPYTNSKVLFISTETCKSFLHETTRTEENSIETIRIAFNRKRNLLFLNLYIRLVIFAELIRLLVKGFRPDIIHVHFFQAGLWASFFCKILFIKLCITEHWSAFIGWPVISKERFLKAAKIFNNADIIITVSNKMADEIRAKSFIKATKKINVIHNAVDSKIFKPEIQQKKNNVIKLLAVSRISEEKDIPNLLAALALLDNNWELTLIGGGDINGMRDIAKDYKIENRVHFIGQKNKLTIANFMQRANLFILSSFIENSPTVIGEALCCGCPVVSTNVGGVSELLNFENGILVASQNPSELAAGIKLAMNTNYNREKIARNAKQIFSLNTVGQAILNCYNENGIL